MVRLILFGIVLIVALVIWIGKMLAGAATGSERLQQESFRSQTQKTMGSAARGINWLNEQWDEAKRAARQPSEDLPFLALLIAFPLDDPEGINQAKRFFEQYAARINARTRIDTSLDDGSEARLARMSIEIDGWPDHAIADTTRELIARIADLERVGLPAFVVRYERGRTEVLAKNGVV